MKRDYKNDDTFLAKWLNNELSDMELSDFKASEDYSLLKKIADKSQLFTQPTFDEKALFEKIQIKNKEKTTKIRRFVPTWVYAVAASLVVLLSLTFFLNQETSVTCVKGEQLAYVLPDGSEVILNGNSSIHFKASHWAKDERILELVGEGYFKVQKGSNFSVNTIAGKVEVLGTEFNVLAQKKYLAVACFEGKVRVSNKKSKSILTPGKGVELSNNNIKSYVFNSHKPNWITKSYNYDAVPLSVVFQDVENEFELTIVNKGIDTTQLYSGKLILDDLNKSLLVICKPMNIDFEIKDQEVVLHP